MVSSDGATVRRAYLRAGNTLLIFIIAWTVPGCGAPPTPASTPTVYRTTAAAQLDTPAPYPTDTSPPVLTATRTPIVLPTLTAAAKAELKFDLPAATSDPFNDPAGPFYHQLLKASSKDGLTFVKEGKVVFDKASVPDIVRLPNGRLIIYAVDGARRSRSGLMVAISDDNGMTWQQGSLQMTDTGILGGADPEVVLLSDGRLRLYTIFFPMKPQAGIIDPTARNQVLSAVSTDGINFQRENGVRFEHAQITDPDVVKIRDRWFMYLSQGPRLIAVSSADGLTFQLEGTVREKGSVSNTVPLGDNHWRQFYCADGGIQSALTSDGRAWQDEPGLRLQAAPDQIMCDPAPVQIGSDWLLFYKSGPLPPKPPKP
jgi:hypothetical protein